MSWNGQTVIDMDSHIVARSVEFCVQELGEDLWLFASDRYRKRELLGENARRRCPRLRT